MNHAQAQQPPQMKPSYLVGIFRELKEGLVNGSERYEAVDHEHVIDVEKGIKYHLYAKTREMPYSITNDEGQILTGDIMLSTEEVRELDQVRGLLQDHFSNVNRVKFFDIHQEKPEEFEQLKMAEGVTLNTKKKK